MSDNLPPIHIGHGTLSIRISCVHICCILSRPSLGNEHSLPDVDIIPLTCSPLPPSVAHYPSGTHQVKRDLDGHLGRVIGSDNTRFFLRIDSLLIGALRTPRIEIAAFFTGTIQSM